MLGVGRATLARGRRSGSCAHSFGSVSTLVSPRHFTFDERHMNIDTSLVSIIVIAYNSGKYILETLESALLQTYKHIELVISDDCSTDNTLEICNEWLARNGKRFFRSQIVTTPINTGVAANANRGINASSGRWIKPLAGDDALINTAISDFVSFVETSNSKICVSKLLLFGSGPEVLRNTQVEYDRYYQTLQETQEQQLNRICKEMCVPGPGEFFSRQLYDEVGGFDERFPFCEEWPFFHGVLKRGYRILLLDKPLVRYRIHERSLCRTDGRGDKRVFDSVRAYFVCERRRQLLERGMVFQAAKQTIRYYCVKAGHETNQRSPAFQLYKTLLKWKGLWAVARTRS